LIEQMQAKVRLIEHLRRDINRWSNRLQAVLLRVNPQPIDLFSRLETEISLQFLMRYPTAESVQGLTRNELEAFCREHHYTHFERLPKLYAHLQADAPRPSPSVTLAYGDQVQFIAQTLLPLVQYRKRQLRELLELYAQHPDHLIFDSLPQAGELLSPGLLVKFGDDRERFPTPASVQALAGTCPVTHISGKHKSILFRRACDKEFRQIATQFARASLLGSPWAVAYHYQLCQHGVYGAQALRCLANRWLAIIWKLWQTRQLYDESYHLKQRYQRHQPRH
jgi:transposase